MLVNDVIYKLKWPYLSPRLGENVPFLVNAVIYNLKWPHFSPCLGKSVICFSQCCNLQVKVAVFYNPELIGTKERCRRIKHAKQIVHFTESFCCTEFQERGFGLIESFAGVYT